MHHESEETFKGDLGGEMSVSLKDGASLQAYCIRHVDNYDGERLQAFTVRILYGREIAVTLYAIDKDRLQTSPESELPVKKFKLPVTFLTDILSILSEANVTLSTGEYPLENMRVINK